MRTACSFCQFIQTSEAGLLACQRSWHKLSVWQDALTNFATCHAGLNYLQTPIKTNGNHDRFLVTGQFFASKPDAETQAYRLKELAHNYQLDLDTLSKAASKLTVLDENQRSQLAEWLASIAETFGTLGKQQSILVSRLRKIASMCDIENQL